MHCKVASKIRSLDLCTCNIRCVHDWRNQQGSHFFIPSNSLTFPWFLKIFLWFFISFHQDILVKKTYLFFLNVALVTTVYANIASLSAISWQFLKKRFYSLIKTFSHRLKGLKMVLKKVPWFEHCFPDFGWKPPVFPWFPWLEKVFKNFPNFPDRWEPWIRHLAEALLITKHFTELTVLWMNNQA